MCVIMLCYVLCYVVNYNYKYELTYLIRLKSKAHIKGKNGPGNQFKAVNIGP